MAFFSGGGGSGGVFETPGQPFANASFTYIEWTWGRDCLQLEGLAVRKTAHSRGAKGLRIPSSEPVEAWLAEDEDSVLPSEPIN